MYNYKGFIIPDRGDHEWAEYMQTFMEKSIDAEVLFESVCNAVKSYNQTISYSDGNISSIIYTISPGITVTKTINYDGNGNATSIVLSGSLPVGISSTTKTISYINGNVSGISYS